MPARSTLVTTLSRIAAAATLVGLVGLGAPARADVPGPRPTCKLDAAVCTVCSESLGGPESERTCRRDAERRGLAVTCSERHGAVVDVWLCPPEGAQKPEPDAETSASAAPKPKAKKEPAAPAPEGGCRACTIGGGGRTPAVAIGLGALAVITLFTRRRARLRASAKTPSRGFWLRP